MTAYGSGTRFEHRCRDILTADGWTVIRSAGSKTKVDLVALGHGQVLLVQCKGGERQISSAEWNLLVDAARAGGATPVLAERRGPRQPLAWWRITGYRQTRSRAMPYEPMLMGETG